jgi:hypothetical protein
MLTAEPLQNAEPAITPREVQMRVRGGEDPEDLAAATGANLDWLMRFAAPVLAERSRITDEARRARARRTSAESQSVIFGETVDARFAAHGIDEVRWDARRREDAQWVVSAHWVGGDAERTAEWAFNLSGRTVSPIDDTAADLLSDRPIRPLVEEPPAPVRLTVAPPLDEGVVAFPAQPNALTGPLPSRQQLFDQSMFHEEPEASAPKPTPPMATPPAAKAPELLSEVEAEPIAPPPVPVAEIDLDDEPGLFPELRPVPVSEPGPAVRQIKNLGLGQREHETEEEKAARAHIPSWDDILLGVRRKND